MEINKFMRRQPLREIEWGRNTDLGIFPHLGGEYHSALLFKASRPPEREKGGPEPDRPFLAEMLSLLEPQVYLRVLPCLNQEGRDRFLQLQV